MLAMVVGLTHAEIETGNGGFRPFVEINRNATIAALNEKAFDTTDAPLLEGSIVESLTPIAGAAVRAIPGTDNIFIGHPETSRTVLRQMRPQRELGQHNRRHRQEYREPAHYRTALPHQMTGSKMTLVLPSIF